MNTSLDHLPDRKRRDLEAIVRVLFAEFENATRLATQKWKKQGRILKVILYGSYARGNLVEDPVGGFAPTTIYLLSPAMNGLPMCSNSGPRPTRI
ncbi:hypothetical protein D2V17_16755 [Aurantiacibacter xanthus]|uniref:Nucleotidyltransferase domain-containing protein n=1 Tax=Aurantiacibacter xanthus TaxID=1784712 RepID=A0A3A1P2L1_9SPHN|nr:hypothetical protein [Aurantiacibacter xanthus]RIV81784.1 hypothetical protein D2V17_16755 [Aurantiacibacter xanthus]